jgi:hypothetical protein
MNFLDWLRTFTPLLMILATVALGIETWVRRRGRREEELQQSLDGKPSIQAQLKTLEDRAMDHGRDLVRLETTVGTLRDRYVSEFTVVDRSIHDLQLMTATLKSGQDEWTKALRRRTHHLSNVSNKIKLRVVLLVREKEPGYTGSDMNVREEDYNGEN